MLKANGASDEEVKALDHPAARKAYEAAMNRAAEAERERAVAAQERQDNITWYNETAMPTLERYEREKTAAMAERARVVELIRQSSDDGLREVAKSMGIEVAPKPGAPPASPGAPETWDAKKHNVPTWDDITTIAEREGMAIAIMGRMVQEHERLFPGGELVDWEALRKQATSSKKPLESVWMEKYNVQAARDKRAADSVAAHEATIRADERKKADEEWASKYGNPDSRPLVPSTSPFTQRKETGRDKQPWQLGGGDDGTPLQRDRVSRATKHVMDVANKTN
jgi:NADH dehydrogenase/NADH:ubiquinone oxidoreductase subunit G